MDYIIEADDPQVLSTTIDSNLFGANFLFDRDRTDGTFAAKAADLGISLLRYPGGSITESMFDVTNPDNTQFQDQGLTPLSDFLSFSAEHGFAPVIVLPVKPYAGDIQRAVDEISQFVADVTAGVYGDVPIHGFEIGNEYNFGAGDENVTITAEEYGELASAIAVAVRDASAQDVEISVQSGYTTEDNLEIISHFDMAIEAAAIDTVVFHSYPWRFDRVEVLLPTKMALANAWTDLGLVEDIFVSEWNIRSLKNYDPELMDYGLSQAAALIELFTELAKSDVDSAAVWGLQQNNRTTLSGDEGSEGLRIAGEAYRMVSEVAPGAQVSTDQLVETPDATFAIHGFERADKSVYFVSALSLTASSVDVQFNLPGQMGAYTGGFLELLTTFEDPELPYAEATVTTLSLTAAEVSDGSVDIPLDMEGAVARLILFKEVTGQEAVTYTGDTGADIASGSAMDDVFYGEAGDDQFQLGAGNDFADLGEGDDHGYGGQGNDRILGGQGNDVISGDDGADILNGGDGDDIITGGTSASDAADIIYAGAGNDMVYGGQGADDIFGMDGDDTILGQEGADILRGQDGHDVISGASGGDEIHGNAGDDFLNGGFGFDRLNGGTGADVFYHNGTSGHGADWVQDFSHDEGDTLRLGISGADEDDFQFSFAETVGAGEDDIAEVFLTYIPTGQLLFAFVDGAAEEAFEVILNDGSFTYYNDEIGLF